VKRVTTSEQAPSIDPSLFWRVMGRFASDVTVITAETVTTHGCGDRTFVVGRIPTLTADDSPPLVHHAGKFGALASGV
jgi:hypothetical protein